MTLTPEKLKIINDKFQDPIPMKTIIVNSMAEIEDVSREMKKHDLHLAGMSNTGLDDQWRLTYLPSSAFNKENQ